MNELTDLQQEYSRLCARIDPSSIRERFRTHPGHDGTVHLEYADGQYHYIATDRGCEVAHRITRDRDEILYWLVSDLTWGMAYAYQQSHRIPGESFRRLLFAKQVEYLERIQPAWAELKRQEIAAILQQHPYNDVAEG